MRSSPATSRRDDEEYALLRFRASDPVLFHFCIQLRPPNAELASRFGAIALGAFERVENHALLELGDGVTQCEEGGGAGRGRRGS